MKHQVWIAFGSNQAEPIMQLVTARKRLAEVMQEEAASHLYRTPPWGGVVQPDFINAVIRYRTDLSPDAVLALMMQVEQEHQRVRTVKNGPRTLDLDVLLYDDVVMQTERLTLPHPALYQRAFVLLPLADIDAQWVVPACGRVVDGLSALDVSGISRVQDVRWGSAA